MKIEVSKVDLKSTCLKPFIKIDQAEMDHSWSNDSWSQMRDSNQLYELYSLSSDDEICGFILFQCFAKDSTCHLLKIALSSKARGYGFAKYALAQIFKSYKDRLIENVYLEVAVNNTSAIKLYNTLGFQLLVEKKKFYSDGSNAYAMQLNL